jgi:hypothetical protein
MFFTAKKYQAALGSNLLFIQFFGFKGVGYGAIVASALILAWRWQHVRSYLSAHRI